MAIKCRVITCGKINKKIILIIVGGLVYSLHLYIESESEIFGGDTNEFPVIYTMMYSICLCLSFSLLLIFNVYSKKKKDKITSSLIEDKGNIIFEKNDTIKKKIISWKEKLLWIFLVSIIDYIAYLFSSIYWLDNGNYVDTLQTNIIFMSIFAYLILKLKLHKHHYLCISVIIIRSIAYTIIFNVYKKDPSKKNDIVPYIVSFVTEIVFSLTYVMSKYFMLIKYIHPFEIMFFEGIFELFFSIMTLIISSLIGKLDNISHFLEKFKYMEVFILISWIIVNFIYHAILFKVIDIFSPFYIHISILLSEFLSFFFKLDGLSIGQLIFYIISFIVCPFMILVFLEIIELNFCGLSEMTAKNIELRALLDSAINDENDGGKISIGADEYSIELERKSQKLVRLESMGDN